MKNLQVTKSHIMLVLLCLCGVGALYGFITYVLQPVQDERVILTTSIEALEPQLRDATDLSKRLAESKQEVVDKELQVSKMKDELDYKPVVYLDFLSTLGDMKDMSGVEILSVTADEVVRSDSHWEIPYNLEVAGDYAEILTFVNGLYQLDMFHIVTDIKLKEDSANLTSSKNTILSKEWATGIKDNIEGVYGKLETAPTDADKADITKMASITGAEVLHLDMSIKFVSIEDPSIRK